VNLRHGETIERIVGFLRHAAQGLEERKQIMSCWGRWVAANRLGRAAEGADGSPSIYVLKAGDDLSPVFESPLACSIPSGWAT